MRYDLVIHLALLLPIFLKTVQGHYGFFQVVCHVLGSLQNVELTYSVYYDKTELLRYNSTENKFVGYSEYAIKFADNLNKNLEWLHKQVEEHMYKCKHFGQIFLPMVTKTVKPEVIVRSLRQNSGKKPALLICSAYDFYPKPIKLTWMRGDEEITADVMSTEEMADGDWYYQIHSQLEYFPQPGEKISCVVEHSSSDRPMIYYWDSSRPEYDWNKIITGLAGVVLGVIMAAGGLIYYKIKLTAHMTSAGSQNIECSEPLQTFGGSR